nr:AbrB family transcriptional regulator [Stakelama flava]
MTIRGMRWALLVALSVLLAAGFELAGLSAGLLLGPMVAAIIFALRGSAMKVHTRLFQAAQALIGILIAHSITGDIAATVIADWPIFLGCTVATLSASACLGYLLSRWQVLPDTTAIWGSMPGAASAMTIMADSFGADSRLVAFMTYTRVVCVAGVASVLAALLTGTAHGNVVAELFAPVSWTVTVVSLGVAIVGAVGGVALGVPAGALVGTLLLGAALNLAGLAAVALPGWLLAIGYALVGWRIGLNFTRETVRMAKRALPRVLMAVAALLCFAFAIALALTRLADIDLLTAYLAVSPGGMDSVAIIAASIKVDLPFVMAMQFLRFAVVLIAGPAVARIAARRFVGE